MKYKEKWFVILKWCTLQEWGFRCNTWNLTTMACAKLKDPIWNMCVLRWSTCFHILSCYMELQLDIDGSNIFAFYLSASWTWKCAQRNTFICIRSYPVWIPLGACYSNRCFLHSLSQPFQKNDGYNFTCVVPRSSPFVSFTMYLCWHLYIIWNKLKFI
jgi:hypothetical protein